MGNLFWFSYDPAESLVLSEFDCLLDGVLITQLAHISSIDDVTWSCNEKSVRKQAQRTLKTP